MAARSAPNGAMIATSDEPARRQRSCLGKAIASGLDGGLLGAAIGAIMASGSAFQLGFSRAGAMLIGRAGLSSALSFGGFLSVYNGGICSLERWRAKQDAFNPFVVGGFIGVAGALPGYVVALPHAPWSYRSPRALVGAGLSTAMLCSFFWTFFDSSRQARQAATDAVAATPAPIVPPAAPRAPIPMPPPAAPLAAIEPPDQPTAPEWESPELEAVPAEFAPTPPTGLAPAGSSPQREQLTDPWASSSK